MSIIYEPSGRAREYADLAANLYSGCSHGCQYCYAPGAMRMNRDEFHLMAKPRKDVLKLLERDCKKLAGSGKQVLLCFSTDPYQPCEEQHQLTRQAIEILHQYGLFVNVLTKGGTRACRDFDLLGPGDAFGTSLTFAAYADSEKWEPGAALSNDRLAAMALAHREGIPTWASMEPVIDPIGTLTLIELAAPYCDFFKVGKLNHHPLEKTIDWRKFGEDAETLLRSLGKPYYIKKDLRECMEVAE